MWQRINDYAKEHDLTRKQVYCRIANGTLLRRKLPSGGVEVSADETAIAADGAEPEDYESQSRRLQIELSKERLANLKADTKLKGQKMAVQIEVQKQEICERVYECAVDGFQHIKDFIIDLRLTEEQSRAYEDAVRKCFSVMRRKLAEYKRKKEADSESAED